MNDAFIIVIALVLAFFLFLFGSLYDTEQWMQDCERIGAHRENGKVYVCYVKG